MERPPPPARPLGGRRQGRRVALAPYATLVPARYQPPLHTIPRLAWTYVRAFGVIQQPQWWARLWAANVVVLLSSELLVRRRQLASMDRHAMIAVIPMRPKRRTPRLSTASAILVVVAPLVTIVLLTEVVAGVLVGLLLYLVLVLPTATHMIISAKSRRDQQPRMRRLTDEADPRFEIWSIAMLAAHPQDLGHGSTLMDAVLPELPTDVHLALIARPPPGTRHRDIKPPRDLMDFYGRYGFVRWPAEDTTSRVMIRPAAPPASSP